MNKVCKMELQIVEFSGQNNIIDKLRVVKISIDSRDI